MHTVHLIVSVFAVIAAFNVMHRLNKWDKSYVPVGKLPFESTIGVIFLWALGFALLVLSGLDMFSALDAFGKSFG